MRAFVKGGDVVDVVDVVDGGGEEEGLAREGGRTCYMMDCGGCSVWVEEEEEEEGRCRGWWRGGVVGQGGGFWHFWIGLGFGFVIVGLWVFEC